MNIYIYQGMRHPVRKIPKIGVGVNCIPEDEDICMVTSLIDPSVFTKSTDKYYRYRLFVAEGFVKEEISKDYFEHWLRHIKDIYTSPKTKKISYGAWINKRYNKGE